ncbi:MAG TPA: 2-oxoglutarate dehydrogenase E1 component [Bacteroidia bacterium]|nr:2-oxoglutarate dehydrogenase E1 component [Bacteroidia bacterium]
MVEHSYLSNADVSVIDDLYKQYAANPESVEFGWKKFFEGFDVGLGKAGANGHAAGQPVSEDALKEIHVLNLIKGYRTRGHLFTHTNPVRERRRHRPTLEIKNFNLDEKDLDKVFNAGVEIGLGPAKLRDIIDHLEKTYCQSVGAEFAYIRDPEKVEWLQKKMEGRKNQPAFSIEEKRHMLDKLNKAVIFENFLHTKFVGQKRFSLEGLETLIPALDGIIQYGTEHGAAEFVIGMAHRGRLNVLANILGKSYGDIFKEFEGKAYEEALFEGDVKYHLGYSSDTTTRTGKNAHISLSPNPSHLETVNPVVEGITRAKLDHKLGGDVDKIIPILIHGDASLAGQGIVYEVAQMAGLDAYGVGGTIHIAANNQVGFTTNYTDGRTSTYCTDVAKVTLSPVFHVNADDVEAVVYTIQVALEFRQKFNTDVYIDLLGYRKYGHNEGDEPRFTQPLLYKAIATHPNPREIYVEKLLKTGSIEAELAKEMEKNFRSELQEKLEMAKAEEPTRAFSFVKNLWEGLTSVNAKDAKHSPETKADGKLFLELANKITDIPADFKPFQKVAKLFADRKEMIKKDSYDWAMGELMAYATLLTEGHQVRMSGQDCERGTFSHRHAVIKEDPDKGAGKQDTPEKEYTPLNNLGREQARFDIYNSHLSEYAVMGFEYGYSMATPNTLTMWEAQFGDFVNGAQIIIDQYLSSAEAKWKTYSGLVLLLPHGHEGQGPEHSSARPERFLQLCANNNMQVANCTTPASLFHLLRRQIHRNYRIPLVIMTPKSLLRHPLCVSKLEDFTKGSFMEVINDTTVKAADVKRVLFCSGKVYYDLLNRRTELKRNDVAIVRIEQLYPFPEDAVNEIRNTYKNAEHYWVQEEPKNQGAYTFLLRYEDNFSLKVIARKSSPSPATGLPKLHQKEQEEILQLAFG